LTGVVSAGNYDIKFIDCIIRGLTLSETFVTPYGDSFFRRCNFKYQSINALQSNKVDVILEDCVNIPDEFYVDTEINMKQDTITSSTDLVSGSITASSAIVNIIR
jgi:hypothetical protein